MKLWLPTNMTALHLLIVLTGGAVSMRALFVKVSTTKQSSLPDASDGGQSMLWE
ncbi:MAG: hypothetical protein ABSA46_01125 [Thermodesulfovibrionales bacterium]